MMGDMVDEPELHRRCEEVTAAVSVTVEEWAAGMRAFGEAARTTMRGAFRPLQEASEPALAAAMNAMRDASFRPDGDGDRVVT